MSVLLMFSGLFGCGESKEYTIDDIVLIHTAYYGTEKNPVYSFALRKEENRWLFSADCPVGEQREHYASFSSFPITDEDAEGFLQIVGEDGEIERLFKYRNPVRIFRASDAPTRSSGITFSDGNSIEKETAIGDRARNYLYALADRCYTASESAVEVTKVYVQSNSMNYSSCYSFCLEKNEEAWYFSFDAAIDRVGEHAQAEKLLSEEDDAEEILNIVKNQRLIARVKQYKKPADNGIYALDETTYLTSFRFADDTDVSAPINAGAELIDGFYDLARAKAR